MFSRLRKLHHNHSFFLFGPRGTGKSTLLKERFEQTCCLFIDLLDVNIERRFFQNPGELYTIVKSLPKEVKYVIIDEVQKNVKLLDEVHRLIEEKDKIYILTGSSARKLKHGGANLLAGRAFVYHLYPLSCFELKEKFNLEEALQWGTLPKIFSLNNQQEKEEFLSSYSSTYLQEEIWGEQVVRKLQPFRRFLEVAAQCNGTIINYKNISKDVGVDEKTIKNYFSILEDTMIGFFLEPHHNSFRKRLVGKPKFYFFDTGVVRSLSRVMSTPIIPRTKEYGDAFEHFLILEFIRLGSYFQKEYRFSFFRTAGGVEIDLIVERPGKPLLCVEIKSTDTISERDIHSFITVTKDMQGCEAIVLSRDRFLKKFDHVTCYPWKQGLEECFPEVKDS